MNFKQKIRKIILPIFLLGVWIVLTGLSMLTYNSSFTVLLYNHTHDYFLSQKSGKLYAKKRIYGEFTAAENNLGIVAVRVHNFNLKNRNEEDTILFRLKDKGAKKWYFTSSNYGGHFHDTDLYPFGFPTIKNSKGKRYYFEIESVKGTEKNAITIVNTEPLITTHYQFSKAEIFQDKRDTFIYFLKKLRYGITNIDFILTSFIYLLSLVFYYIVSSKIGNKSKYLNFFVPVNSRFFPKDKRIRSIIYQFRKISMLDMLIILSLFIDIKFIGNMSSIIPTIIVSLWLSRIVVNKYNSKKTFLIAFFILLFIPYLAYYNQNTAAEKAAVWVYILLLIGILQSLLTTSHHHE